MQYSSSCCVLDIHKIMQIAYSENFQALFRHVNDVGTDTVHEILRVRDDNKNATIPEKYGIYKRSRNSKCLYKCYLTVAGTAPARHKPPDPSDWSVHPATA